MENQNTQVATINDKFITGLGNILKEKQKYGMSFPNDYNIDNELFGAYVAMKNDTKGNPLVKCDKDSVANALMQMVSNNLSFVNGQCYLVPYGNKLTFMPSTYGNEVNAKRAGMKKINASVIYEDDKFEMHKEDAVIVIDKHETSFKNIDITKIVGAYAVAIMEDGSKVTEVMNKSQIEQAWKQGFGYKENGNGVHQKFTDQMCEKTVKNRLMKHIIRSCGDRTATYYEDTEEQSTKDIYVESVQNDIATAANSKELIMDEPQPTVEHPVEVVETTVEEDVPDFA